MELILLSPVIVIIRINSLMWALNHGRRPGILHICKLLSLEDVNDAVWKQKDLHMEDANDSVCEQKDLHTDLTVQTHPCEWQSSGITQEYEAQVYILLF
jgi:hypothetical protein